MSEHLNNSESSSNIDLDILYEFVLEEMQTGNPRKGLLTKAVIESNGDDDKAKSLYLQYRVEAIKNDMKALGIDIKKISKEKLFTLIENDFNGYKYKDSSQTIKRLFFLVLLLLFIAVAIIIYPFLPQEIKDRVSLNKKEIQEKVTNPVKETTQQVVQKKLEGIRDSYGNLYKEIKSPFTKRIWLDRNLGAKQVCIGVDDEKCFGDYFQWGRTGDGHEKATSDITPEVSTNEIVDHDKFILGSSDNRYDWLKFQNNTLWQGHYGENNPCPQGFRLPTAGEFKAEVIDHGGTNKYKLYKSFLKLPMAGFRNYEGLVNNQGFEARFWASSRKSQFSLALSSSNGGERPYIFFFERSNGYNVRCIKDSK